MLLSAAFLSVSFLFLQINLKYFEYFFLLFLRFFIPLLIVCIVITWRLEWKLVASLPNLFLQLARAACVLISQYGIAYYLTKNTLLNATTLLNASPLFIPLFEWIFLKRRPGKSTMVGAIISFFGVLLILRPDLTLFSVMSLVGLIAAAGQAGSQVLYGLRAKNESLSISLFFLFFLTSLASFCIYFFLRHLERIDFFRDFGNHLTFFSITTLSMAVATLLNQFFRGFAYRHGRPSALSPFLYFSVFISALLDWAVFKHVPTFLTILGACLIIFGGLSKIILRAKILKKK